MWLLLRRLPKGIGSSLNAPRCILSDWGRDFDVATIRDASPEKLSFVLPRTISATGCRIADLTRWKLFCPKIFHFLATSAEMAWAWETVGSNVASARKRATAPTLILQSSRMANLLILSPRSTVGFLPERRGSLRRPFYSSLLPESAMTRFSPPFLPVSRQEARRSSGSGTHQMRLTVNLKTAKTLGVEVSRSVLRAACSGLPRS